jgi:arsenate reductase-like glutaredoxin family protein
MIKTTLTENGIEYEVNSYRDSTLNKSYFSNEKVGMGFTCVGDLRIINGKLYYLYVAHKPHGLFNIFKKSRCQWELVQPKHMTEDSRMFVQDIKKTLEYLSLELERFIKIHQEPAPWLTEENFQCYLNDLKAEINELKYNQKIFYQKLGSVRDDVTHLYKSKEFK